MINSWELNLPKNWNKYVSTTNNCIGISEIVFKQNNDCLNSFLRKNIIIDMDLKITCNILGNFISADKFHNCFSKVTSQQQLENVIKEVATAKVCRGLDFRQDKK